MNLSTHFTLAEFTDSDTALRCGIDNSLPSELMGNAIATCLLLERIRDYLSEKAGKDIPIIISSGYRCPALNMAVHSSSTSDHPKAYAADIKAPAFGTPYQVCMALKDTVDLLGIGQLLYEFGGWLHVSQKMVADQKNRVLTIDSKGIQQGIQAIR